MYIILVGQLLMGSGVTPFYTLGLAYIEDSVSKRSASIYLGIANAASALGPVIGFIAGGVILSDYYVDFDKVSEPPLPNYDPRWVGAWWVFLLAAMEFTWLLAVPMSGFPKQLPGTAKNRKNRVSEVHQNGGAQIANKDGFGSSYEDLPRAIVTLLKNPTYVIITVCGCLQSLLIAGTAAFFAKYIENAFRMSVGDAAVLSGAVSVPAGAVGNILGGLLI
ncbi:solute carrier organic anion transporter family member 4C1-like isoform X2 [Clavelina lepadiformis]|uniref:solute carrier organic anion transporter family member 4C1-like isoform X2 n=1 Tax=Clavelina lepadiformis TaxID=159417 RepID=UPI0040411E1D